MLQQAELCVHHDIHIGITKIDIDSSQAAIKLPSSIQVYMVERMLDGHAHLSSELVV